MEKLALAGRDQFHKWGAADFRGVLARHAHRGPDGYDEKRDMCTWWDICTRQRPQGSAHLQRTAHQRGGRSELLYTTRFCLSLCKEGQGGGRSSLMAAESAFLSVEEKIRQDVYTYDAAGGASHAGPSFQSLVRELVRCSLPETKAGALAGNRAAGMAFDRVLFICPEVQADDDWSVRPNNVMGERQPPCIEAVGYEMRARGSKGAARLEELARQTASADAVLLPKNGPHKPERVLPWGEQAAVQNLLLLLRDCGTPGGVEVPHPGAARFDTTAAHSKSAPEIVMINAPHASTKVLERVPDAAVDDSCVARPEEMRMFHAATFDALAWPSGASHPGAVPEDRARLKLTARPPARAAGVPLAGDLFGAVSHRWEHGGLCRCPKLPAVPHAA